jgi:hypothetical protein
MVEPLRHRQTKGAATDMFFLTPPRHISTLPIRRTTIYQLRSVSRWVPGRMAVAPANLFSNEDVRLYLPLSVGLAFKESHGAARNWRCLLVHH